MGKSTKLGIAVSLLSVLVIGGSVYYYNDSLSKSNEKIQQTTVTTTVTTTTETKLKQNKENVKITTEIKDEKFVIVTIENIANRHLTDVVVESTYKGLKNAEILITNFDKGAKKKIEIPLENKLNTASIKENEELSKGFRMLERAEFSVGENKGEVIVSTLKSQTKEFYIEKVKISTLEQTQKDELIKKIETAKTIEEIEKLLKDNKVINEVKLSTEHVTFKEGESELKIETISISETTTSTSQTEQESTIISVMENNQVVTPNAVANNTYNQTMPTGRNTVSTSSTQGSGTGMSSTPKSGPTATSEETDAVAGATSAANPGEGTSASASGVPGTPGQ